MFANLHARGCEQILPSVPWLLCLEPHPQRPLLHTQHYIKFCDIRHSIHSMWHCQRGRTEHFNKVGKSWEDAKIQTEESALKTSTNWNLPGICRGWKCPGDYGLSPSLLKDKDYLHLHFRPLLTERSLTAVINLQRNKLWKYLAFSRSQTECDCQKGFKAFTKYD